MHGLIADENGFGAHVHVVEPLLQRCPAFVGQFHEFGFFRNRSAPAAQRIDLDARAKKRSAFGHDLAAFETPGAHQHVIALPPHQLHRDSFQPVLFRLAPPIKFAMSRELRGFQAFAVRPGYAIRRWYYPAGTPGTRAER